MATWRYRGKRANGYYDVDYQPVPTESTTVDYKPEVIIPWRSICFASVLCLIGIIMLSVGLFELFGDSDKNFIDHILPMIVLGMITITPGAYYVRIFILCLLNHPGYSFDDIPTFN